MLVFLNSECPDCDCPVDIFDKHRGKCLLCGKETVSELPENDQDSIIIKDVEVIKFIKGLF